jgi:hypothetical protein
VGSDPAGQGYLSSSSIIAGKRDLVTLSAGEGTKTVRVRATLKSDPTIFDCKEISQTSVVVCK